ncbi:MAG: hypothetical protein ACRESK_02305, partial [Gammaproteobacteria bacterium]
MREFLGQDHPATGTQASPPEAAAGMTVSPLADIVPLGAATGTQDIQAAQLQVIGDNKNPPTFVFEELQRTLDLVDQNQRSVLLEDEESFRNFVKKEATNKSIYAAAQANKIDQNEKNLLIARRGAENILREIYLKQLIASKIPQDFPSEEQITTYYEKNRDKFV